MPMLTKGTEARAAAVTAALEDSPSIKTISMN